MKIASCFTKFLLLLPVAIAATLVHGQGTRVGFYSGTCPLAESIVQSTVQTHFQKNPAIAPGLLRMHFHDCFVMGCDASVLIDGSKAEKTHPANVNLRGFEVIDDAKTQLEAACPGVVSCADVLALAARDAVVLTNGPRWQVPTGRRDGRVSSSTNVNLPSPRDSINGQKQKFAQLGLNVQDMVTLIGGHTIGTSACQFFSYRLFNFNSTGSPDQSISPAFLPQLQALCPQNGDGTKRVDLDTGGAGKFDTSFYMNLRDGKGVLESDQKLWTDDSTKSLVQRFLGARAPLNFSMEFSKAMVKMSNIGVKTGNNGEIRRICSAVN